jgi:AcrR family transcriptional regulator
MNDKTIPRRTQAERTDEARAALCEAAIELIAERGLVGVTLSDVGARAGYSRGLAVYHFGSKSGLILAVFDHLRSASMKALSRFVDVPNKSGAPVQNLIEAISSVARSAPAMYRATTAMLIDGSTSTDDAVREHTRAADEAAERSFKNAVNALDNVPEGSNRDALARTLTNAVYGIQLRAFIHGEKIDLAAEFDAIAETVRMLTKRP